MAEKLIECVPNISEGRNRKVIDAIVEAAAIDGVKVLDVDPGADTHRTVITLLGAPHAIEEAAYRLIAKSFELIDMTHHRGEHPRQGATDVCPFVPVAGGVTMADCVQAARRVGARVGAELKLPVYLYEHAATRPERRSLAAIRQGEYEALPTKLKSPEWKPDFGPAEFVPRFGAVTIGAREFLIAFNVNLNSRSKAHASEIASLIRETGHAVRTGQTSVFYASGALLKYDPAAHRFPCGECLDVFQTFGALEAHARARHEVDLRAELAFFGRDPERLEGVSVMRRGRFAACRAVGWLIPEYGRAQVSINLTDFRTTPPHAVLEECRRLAAERGLIVTGSEVVGLIPYEALRESGRFYLSRQKESRGAPVSDVIATAVQSLGLSDVHPFEPRKSVLGLPVTQGFAARTLAEFADEVSRDSPAPGGGSVAALAGALAAALASMVANLTFAKKGNGSESSGSGALRERMEEIALRSQEIKDELLGVIQADADSFGEVIQAMRLPKGTPAEIAAREAAIQEGYKSATRVPLRSAELALEALKLCREAAERGLRASVSDAGVGGLMAHAAFRGASYNVLINLKSIRDERFAGEVRARLSALSAESTELLAAVQRIFEVQIAAP